MYDYEATLKSIHAVVRPHLNNIPFVEQATTEEYPEYPFGTYTITNPYLNAKTYISSGQQVEEFEIVISYTILSLSSFESNKLAQSMAAFLKRTGTRQTLQDVGIVIVRQDGFGSRDNFISIEVERRTGFDLRIRVRNIEENTYQAIDTVV